MKAFGAARALLVLKSLIMRGLRLNFCHDVTPRIPPETHLA